MKQFRWLEVFYSIQGEGLHAGKPSLFIRLFGCNLKCQGFGMPAGKLSDAYLAVDVTQHRSVNTLPLVATGCDSYAAWDPRCKHLTTVGGVPDLVDVILEKASTPQLTSPLAQLDLVMTGGEPLLGWQDSYPELFHQLQLLGISAITFETNGTQVLSAKLKAYLESSKLQVTWSISPKLPESGEPWQKAIVPPAVESLVNCQGSQAYFKFVVSRKTSIPDVYKALDEYSSYGITAIPVYLMPTGCSQADYKANASKILPLCLANRWHYSPRLHIDLFDNQWGT